MAAVLERPEVVLFLVLPGHALLGRGRRLLLLVGVVGQVPLAAGTDNLVVAARVAGEALAGRGDRDAGFFGDGGGSVLEIAVVEVGDVVGDGVVHVEAATTEKLDVDVVGAGKAKSVVEQVDAPSNSCSDPRADALMFLQVDERRGPRQAEMLLLAVGVEVVVVIVAMVVVRIREKVIIAAGELERCRGCQRRRGIIQGQINDTMVVPENAAVAACKGGRAPVERHLAAWVPARALRGVLHARRSGSDNDAGVAR